MHHELSIQTACGMHKVFLQEGFYSRAIIPTPLHWHAYAEVHLTFGGNAQMRVGKQEIPLCSGDVLVIPPGVYHTLSQRDAQMRHVAFQIDADVDKPIHRALPPTLLEDFFQKIEECAVTGDHTEVAAYITFLCFSLWGKEHTTPKPITDYGILIREFFSNNYNRDVRLCDLARALHLSERQTERLVIEHTGNTFRRELTISRLNMANHLMQSTSLSMHEIAHYVGYQSYAGFWKAMRAYTEATEKT